MLKNALSLLVHTPIFQAGINFGFSEESPSKQIQEALSLSDESVILDTYSVEEKIISRRLSNDGDFVLNFSIAEKEAKYNLSFNFHYEPVDIARCNNIFSDSIIERHFSEAQQLAENCYNIELQTEETRETHHG